MYFINININIVLSLIVVMSLLKNSFSLVLYAC
jgi:hypothetical protein